MGQNPGQFNSNDDILLALDTTGISDTNDVRINPATAENQLSDYLIEVSRGNITGQSYINVTGYNPSMLNSGIFENIWDYGGTYTYLTADTQLYASSTNANDTGIVIAVFGLDENYAEVTRTVTLNGQNQVALSGLMFRIHRALVTGSTETQGDVYIAESDSLTGGVPDTVSKIKALIYQNRQITQMGQYTVPAGKTAYATFVSYTTDKGNDVCFESRLRLFGGVFFSNAALDIYQTSQQFDVRGVSAPEKTDIDFYALASNIGSVAGVALKLLIIDN